MKNYLHLTSAFLFFTAFFISCGQNKETKITKKEIRIEQNNGKKTITIVENDNGKETTKTLSGKEAENYLDEHENGDMMFFTNENNEDGEHVFVVKRSCNGNKDENIWISENGDFGKSANEMTAALEKLQEDLDGMNKKDISNRIEKILERQEKANNCKKKKVMVVNGSDMSFSENNGKNMKVEVDDEKGTITITETVDGKETVKTIDISEGKGEGKKIVIIKEENEG